MGGASYYAVFDSGVTVSCRGRFLGILTDREGGVRLRAYAAQSRYRYCFWDWAGFLYKRD